MPQIDVILTLNEAHAGLSGTVASVLAQSLRDLRLIVAVSPAVEGVRGAIDTDDPRVEIHALNGRSAAALRNKAMDLAEAPFVAFLEAGDTLTPSALTDLVAGARAGRVGAACGSWLVADAGGAPDGPPIDPPEGSSTFYAMWQFMKDHPYDLEAGDSPYLSSGLPEYFPEWCSVAE